MASLNSDVQVISMMGTDKRIQDVIIPMAMQDLIWSEAEHTIDEFDSARLSVVLLGGRPVAWAGWKIYFEHNTEILQCCLNYETRGVARVLGLYELARMHRHLTVVKPSLVQQRTYLFQGTQILADHYHEGWTPTGFTGPAKNGSGQKWVELTRPGRS